MFIKTVSFAVMTFIETIINISGMVLQTRAHQIVRDVVTVLEILVSNAFTLVCDHLNFTCVCTCGITPASTRAHITAGIIEFLAIKKTGANPSKSPNLTLYDFFLHS